MNKQRVLSVVLAVALAVSVTVNIVLWIAWPEKTTELPMIDPVDTPTTPTAFKEMTDIDTPYGVVRFPAAFSDVRHQVTEQNGAYTLTFFYPHGDETVELFAVHFGNGELGTLIGYIAKDGAEIPFTVTSAEASVGETWPTADQEYFKALMMAVNDVIASVQEWDSFVG